MDLRIVKLGKWLSVPYLVTIFGHGIPLVTEKKPNADILNNKFESVFTIEGDTSSLPTMHSPQVPRVQEIHFTTPGVQKLLSNLNTSKAAGIDGISAKILKDFAFEISPILTRIFN